jgi:hypothetical protein
MLVQHTVRDSDGARLGADFVGSSVLLTVAMQENARLDNALKENPELLSRVKDEKTAMSAEAAPRLNVKNLRFLNSESM